MDNESKIILTIFLTLVLMGFSLASALGWTAFNMVEINQNMAATNEAKYAATSEAIEQLNIAATEQADELMLLVSRNMQRQDFFRFSTVQKNESLPISHQWVNKKYQVIIADDSYNSVNIDVKSSLVIDDFYLRMDVSLREGHQDSIYGVFVRKLGEQYILFVVRNGAEFSVVQIDGSLEQEIYDWQTTEVMNADSNLLEVFGYADKLRFFINGHQVTMMTEVEESGGIGIHAALSNQGGKSIFDFSNQLLRAP